MNFLRYMVIIALIGGAVSAATDDGHVRALRDFCLENNDALTSVLARDQALYTGAETFSYERLIKRFYNIDWLTNVRSFMPLFLQFKALLQPVAKEIIFMSGDAVQNYFRLLMAELALQGKFAKVVLDRQQNCFEQAKEWTRLDGWRERWEPALKEELAVFDTLRSKSAWRVEDITRACEAASTCGRVGPQMVPTEAATKDALRCLLETIKTSSFATGDVAVIDGIDQRLALLDGKK